MDINKFNTIAESIREIKTALGRIEKTVEDEKVKFNEDKIKE